MNDQEWNKLIEALRATDNIDRAVAAAGTIHKTSAIEDLPRLMELLKDQDFFVREAAAWPVSELAGPAALPELLVALQRGFGEGHDNDGFQTALIELAEANRTDIETYLHASRNRLIWLLGKTRYGCWSSVRKHRTHNRQIERNASQAALCAPARAPHWNIRLR